MMTRPLLVWSCSGVLALACAMGCGGWITRTEIKGSVHGHSWVTPTAS